MTKNIEIAKSARNLLLTKYQGILSTHSIDVPGYPFGSVIPYCLDRQGRPVMLISRIAQHTKNILANPKVSLIVTEGDADDAQTVGRMTCLGDVIKAVEDDVDTAERYYRYFPQSRDYHKTHDFDFYYIDLVRVRYIGGFGKIHWVEKEDFLLSNPFNATEETRIVEHMNSDHSEALHHYCKLRRIELKNGHAPIMAGIDSEGFHLRIGSRIHWIGFDAPVHSTTEVRNALIAMAKGPVPA